MSIRQRKTAANKAAQAETPAATDAETQTVEANDQPQGEASKAAATEPAQDQEPAQASEAKPSEKDEKINTPPQEGEIPAIYVRTKRRFKSRRRAGFRFNRQGHGIALEALSDEQLASLRADPALEVQECTFPLDGVEDEE